MDFFTRNTKRIVTDAAGYFLILAGIATGWLPGPGGIPLIVAGLGVLSINNHWARRIRVWVVENGGRALELLFPKWPWLEWAYDVVALLLLVIALILALRHETIWHAGVGVTVFFFALLIILSNRDRLKRLRGQVVRH